MFKQSLLIEEIPSVIWGAPSKNVFVAVHGDLSNKEDTVIAMLAQTACKRGWQVLSFDLPGYGERKDGNPTNTAPQPFVRDLSIVMEYASRRWETRSLFACSMGAYFSLLTYLHEPLRQCLFLSPVVSMEVLIENLMKWFQISEEQLHQEQRIATPAGVTLYWDYYTYVRAHPITVWNSPTAMLRGENDTISDGGAVMDFAERFHAALDIEPGGEHFFHTPEQLADFQKFLDCHLLPAE